MKKPKVIATILVCVFLVLIFTQKVNPIAPVRATGETDKNGNLLATTQDDDAGVGDVFVFKRSFLDMTGIFCRYEAEKGAYRWAPEFTLLTRNKLWVQWITFEPEWTAISLNVRLVDEKTDENGTFTRTIVWNTNKSALMVKGYLFFALPTSKQERILEVQRFNPSNENGTQWDEMLFSLKHRTLASIIPILYLPAQVFISNLISIILTLTSASLGGFWRAKKILGRSYYPPARYSWVFYIAPPALLILLFQIEALLNIMMQNIFMYAAVYLIMFIMIYLMFNYGVTQLFRHKPPLIAIQEIIIDSENEYFGLPTTAGYVYDFIDNEGNTREGWIPAGLLEDGGEFKRRMQGNHRRLIPVALKKKEIYDKETEQTTFDIWEEESWGLIADDPHHTYQEIRIAIETHPPYKRKIERRIPIMEDTYTEFGVPTKVQKKNWRRKPMFKTVVEVIEEEHMRVVAAPYWYKTFYEALRDAEKYQELAFEFQEIRIKYRSLQRNMQKEIDEAVTEEVKLITDGAMGSFISEDLKTELKQFEKEVTSLLTQTGKTMKEHSLDPKKVLD